MQVLENKKGIAKISLTNLEFLKQKKQKLRLNSIDEVISLLLERETEFSILKKVEKRKNVKDMQSDDKLNTIEKPKTELPSLNGKCLFIAEREDRQIDCAKDFVEKNVFHVLTKEQCNECWNKTNHIIIEPLRRG